MRQTTQTYKWLCLAVFVLFSAMMLASCVGEEDPEATIEGTWAGVMHHTYYCENEPSTIQLDITETTITITSGSTFTTDIAGTITQQTGQVQAYNVTLNDGGSIQGQLFVDPTKNYALLVIYSGPSANVGYVGVLQKGDLTSTTYQESDLEGNWAGVAVRVNANFEVTESSESSATITNPSGLALSGTDGDGSFSAAAPGIALQSGYETLGIYVSEDGGTSQVDWSGDLYDAIYFLSYDKMVLAVAFLSDSDGGLCGFTIFNELPSQKFAIWLKQ